MRVFSSVAVAAFLIVAGCSPSAPPKPKSKPIKVGAGDAFLKDLVDSACGANCVFVQSDGAEFKVTWESNRGPKPDENTLTVATGFSGGRSGGANGWQNLETWSQAVAKLGPMLAKLRPEVAKEIEERAAKAAADMMETETQFKAALAGCKGPLITGNAKLGPFAEHYGLTANVKAAEFKGDKPPKALFIEGGEDPSPVKALQKQLNAKGADIKIAGELFSDRLAPGQTVTETLRHNVEAVAAGLK
ncbi:MAG: zinc ABC transporter substrate-binding protein [Armatimonadetes bacterium]|nr:zinc ABC transporter substrate-binding protein [Armatimonadota bacterium]MBX3108689.1 zinc ABC transporter substrate-binding protein [Fimbriimonadaceae bacterium]